MEDEHYSELLIELECPICVNYMSPPIRQCTTGHSVCETCRKKLLKCALCKGNFTESRNIALESLAKKMRYPCINRQSGCKLRLGYDEREAHELKCSFKDYKCPMEKCCWVGKLDEVAQHWRSKKMISKPYEASNVCQIRLKSESYYVNIVEAYNKLFWFKYKLSNNKIYWAMQLVGNSWEAENYFYEIEIVKPNHVKRKILISDYCQSIDIENARLFNRGACISVSSDVINHYLGNDQLLVYHMRVYVIENESQEQATCRIQKQRDRSREPQNRYKYYTCNRYK